MPTIAYFGNRYLSFSATLGLKKLMWVTNCLPESEADIVVLDTPFEKSLKLPKGVIGVVCSNNPEAVMCNLRHVLPRYSNPFKLSSSKNCLSSKKPYNA